MFEQNEKDVESMMQTNSEFRALYYLHKELDSKVRDAELGVLPIDDVTLHKMKKEKLHAKDKLTTMWEHRALAAAH
ncbi:MAG: YdcH family protein [Dokdonella sp.]